MKRLFGLCGIVVCLTSCATTNQRMLDSGENQLALRSIQSRVFETKNKKKTLRTIMATLQDLGFVIDKADHMLGTVSGTKLDYYQLKMTVSVRKRPKGRLLIRASAEYAARPVTDPQPYQDFFTSLSKAMFLTAHQVD
jgi:hypothetical protein